MKKQIWGHKFDSRFLKLSSAKTRIRKHVLYLVLTPNQFHRGNDFKTDGDFG